MAQNTCGINRNIVECKEYSWTKIKGDSGVVLIETLWNVKTKRKR